MHAAVVIALAYLAGSVPFAWMLTKLWAGVDIRTVGSGNVGATNVSRVLGRRGFVVVFALDAAKGALPVLFFPALLASDAAAVAADAERVRIACGLAAIVGHMFPVFLMFRGGKGVATGAGVMSALVPLPAACAFGVFVAVLATTRYVSLGSVVASVALAPLSWAFGRPWEVVVLSVVVAALVLFRHRTNLGRIAAGTEPRVFRGVVVDPPSVVHNPPAADA